MGFGSIISALGRGAAKAVSKGASAARSAANSGVASRAVQAVRSNPDALLAGISLVQGAMQDRNAQRLEGQALARAQELFGERAPLRRLALERLQTRRAVRPVADVFADPSNPYG